MKNIRNLSIIAHIDHGKSTLADRFLELTGTIEKRQMREQFLDMMDLERERGITIKMQPVRIAYKNFVLNLIDTPGHIDFSYEVSRALRAVEGVILLVDATQGVQAQTLTVLALARELNLKIIPVINKIDLPVARVAETKQEIKELLHCAEDEISLVSGKTGTGVAALLEKIIEMIPPPRSEYPTAAGPRALVFDFAYDNHQGIIVYARIFDGQIKAGDQLVFAATGENFTVLETGIFAPRKKPTAILNAGEIGYIVTGIKNFGQTKVGDTLINPQVPLPAIIGYAESTPLVWASLYPENQKDLPLLRQALQRLKLSDAALSFEEESSSSGGLGRGFRCGFLGLLHLEIITERLRREFSLTLVIAAPTIAYHLVDQKTGATKLIRSPQLFPDNLGSSQVLEPWVAAKIIVPLAYLSAVIKLFNEHEINLISADNFSYQRTILEIELPLRELMRNFFDELKSVSSGFASLSYQPLTERPAEVIRLDILVDEKIVPAFSRIVARKRMEREAQEIVEKLKNILPRQLITIKIQARALGRIIAARSLSARRKDVTDYLYGGDITRKMKLREKQKKGKKKMQTLGTVNIPHEVFLRMVRTES